MIWVWIGLASIAALYLVGRAAQSTPKRARMLETRGALGTKANGPNRAASFGQLWTRAKTAELPKTSPATTLTPEHSGVASASSAAPVTQGVAVEWQEARRQWIAGSRPAEAYSPNMGSVGHDNTPGVGMIAYGWADCPRCEYKHTQTTTCDAAVELAARDASTGALTHASFYMCPACGLRHKNAMPDMLTCGEFAARTYNVDRLAHQAVRAKDTWTEAAQSAERHWQIVDRLENTLCIDGSGTPLRRTAIVPNT